jgi:hypothetical protein
LSFRTNVKSNIPRVDLQSYIMLIAGNYKSGKTRLWKELIEYYYPNEPEAGTLIAWEGGFRSWKLNSIIDLTEYKKEEPNKSKYKQKTELEMDADRWEYFEKEIVRGLVQEANEGRVSKVIGFDTVDRMIDCSSASIIVQANQKYGTDFESIQEMSESKSYKENVWTNLYDKMKRPMDSIRSAGYGIILLAWTKEKTTELIDGMKYNSIELMMNNTSRKVFQSQADLICCLHNDVTVTDKDGKELDKNLEDKKGREKATNFHESQTNMYFRESNYISIAGGRFKKLPEKVPYGIEAFAEVFENAVKGQLDEGDSVEDIRKVEVKEREEKAHKFSEQVVEDIKNEISAAELIEKINEEIKRFNVSINKVIAPEFKKIIGGDYRKSEDVDSLGQAYDFVKDLKSDPPKEDKK